MENAIAAVLTDQMTPYGAAKTFKVPESTLRDHLKKVVTHGSAVDTTEPESKPAKPKAADKTERDQWWADHKAGLSARKISDKYGRSRLSITKEIKGREEAENQPEPTPAPAPTPAPSAPEPTPAPTPEPTGHDVVITPEPTPEPTVSLVHDPQPLRPALGFKPDVDPINRQPKCTKASKDWDDAHRNFHKRYKTIFRDNTMKLKELVELHNCLNNYNDYLVRCRQCKGNRKYDPITVKPAIRRTCGSLQGQDFFVDACTALNLNSDAGLDEMLQAIQQWGEALSKAAHHLRGHNGFIPTIR